ncbi:NDR1/HIN1-like protein 3 [Phalaenopsis equestris]|uniref:NDR1/HIN1-like protein 3 n=1 Tax=Phalaenopsis equestris TaxID=78828 RepID=UPI0009E31D62|nr:NDR1/HIN1-like protein 3 [Phalaenopsis equestris]
MASNAKPSGGLNGAYYGPSIPPTRTHRSVGGRSSACCCDPCGCLLCSLFKLIFSIIITLGIIVLILWLVFRPNELKVAVEDAKLTSFDLSNSSNLNYNLSLSISIRNPNRRISIYYDQIEAVALYDGSRFGYDGSLPVFFQGHKNTTVISPRFGGQAVSLGAVSGTYEREKKEGNFYVDVKLNARIRLKVKFVKVGHFKPKFDCKLKLPVPPAKGGSPATVFERTECDVDWI